jgi:excisionase family DNA binding protein
MNSAEASQSFVRFLTIGDVADILAITVDEALELVDSGELAAIRVGRIRGQWRVEQRELEDYVNREYENTRRMLLWRESNMASIREIGLPARPPLDD